MTQSDARFTGSIPEIYHEHLGALLFDPYAADLAARLAPLDGPHPRLLELAAGTGILTRHLRQRLGGRGTIVATDLNEAMLHMARTGLGWQPGLEWRQADAAALPFAAESFDAVVCQFGLMFFSDKPAAVSEVFRVLRPGGQFLLSVWDRIEENPLGRIAHETIAAFFPGSPPEFYLVPFGFHDTAVLGDLLENAGFEDIRAIRVGLETRAPSAEHAATGLVRGNPVLTAIEERGTVEPDLVIAAVATALAKAYGQPPVRIPMRAHVVTARRPTTGGDEA